MPKINRFFTGAIKPSNAKSSGALQDGGKNANFVSSESYLIHQYQTTVWYHLKARWLLVFNPHPHFANVNPRSGIAREHSK